MRPINLIAVILTVLAAACSNHSSSPEVAAEEREPWAITAFGTLYEIFAEVQSGAPGEEVLAYTHITTLADNRPLTAGTVTLVFRDHGRDAAVASGKEPTRPGIYSLRPTMPGEGTYAIVFRIESPAGVEEVAAGEAQIAAGSGPVFSQAYAPFGTAPTPGQATSYFKEYQWVADFSTAWATQGTLPVAIHALGRVIPPAGGEVVLTAPVSGTIHGNPWPHEGMACAEGGELFRIVPREDSGRSAAGREAALKELEEQLRAARGRLERVENLESTGAVSRRDLEALRAEVAGLTARAEAERSDRDRALAVMEGRMDQNTPLLRSPLSGRVASVSVTPGQFVEVGTPLARIVRARPVWIEVPIPPAEADRTKEAPRGLLYRRSGDREPQRVEAADLAWVARSPQTDPATGLLKAILKVDRSVDELALNSSLNVDILSGEDRTGVLLPATALVDEGGVLGVYIVADGEHFVRTDVQVLARQEPWVLVGGLTQSVRVVTRGGQAIRRTALMATGGVEGHVH